MSISANLPLKLGGNGFFPANRQYQVFNGNPRAAPAPGTRHQIVLLRMAAALLEYVEAGKLGRVFQAPYDIVLSRSDVVQPDILFIRRERRGMIGEMNLQGAPDLVVEVLSQSTRAEDLKIKRTLYSRFEIPEYWVVDPGVNAVEVLIWSEMGYASAGVYGKSDRLSSPLLPLNLPLSGVFCTENE